MTDIRTELLQHIEHHVHEAETSANGARSTSGADSITALGFHAVTHALLANARATQLSGLMCSNEPDPELPAAAAAVAAAADETLERELETARRQLLTAFNLQHRVNIAGELQVGPQLPVHRCARVVGVDENTFVVETSLGNQYELPFSGLRSVRRLAQVSG
jgi:hypothetical protein